MSSGFSFSCAGGYTYVLPGKDFPHRTYLMGNMLDAVNDRTIRIREDDVAVFSHDLDDQLLLAKITHFIKVF